MPSALGLAIGAVSEASLSESSDGFRLLLFASMAVYGGLLRCYGWTCWPAGPNFEDAAGDVPPAH